MTSFALSTFLLYWLVLPGLLLQGGYCRGGIILPRNRRGTSTHPSRKHPSYPSSSRGLAEDVLKSILAAACLHCLWGLIWAGCGIHISYLMVYEVVSGRATYEQLSKPLAENWGWIFGYFLSITAIPPFIGRWLLSVVRWLELDHRYKLFRFNDPWFYLIRGEIFDLPEFGATVDSKTEIDAVVAVAVIGSGDDTIAYAGYVREWELNDKGSLSRLILADCGWSKVRPGVDMGKMALYPAELVVLEYDRISTLSFCYTSGQRPSIDKVLNPISGRNLIEVES